MWISRSNFQVLTSRVAILEADRKVLTESINLILGHLKLKLWTEPAVEKKRVLLTEKEYEKRQGDKEQGFRNYLNARQQSYPYRELTVTDFAPQQQTRT